MIFLISIFILFLICSVFAGISYVQAERGKNDSAIKYYNWMVYSWGIIVVLCLINLI